MENKEQTEKYDFSYGGMQGVHSVRHRYRWYSNCFNIKQLLCMIAVLACLFGIVRLMPAMQANASDEKIVRVGFYEEENFQSGLEDDTLKSGYSYDYLSRLKLYNNWKYEYVYGSYAKLYDMLLKGEIDLLAGLDYTPERTAVLSYPRDPMGETKYYFLKRSSDDQITSDPATINGKRVGVLKGAQTRALSRYLTANNITAQVVEFGDTKERDEAIISGNIDIMVAEDEGAFSDIGIEVFADVGAVNFFCVVSKARPDILDDLNQSQKLMKRENPNFISELNQKWFKDVSLTTTLLPSERKWLAEHDTIKVGYMNDYLPFSTQDSDGNVTGVLKDVLPEIFRSLKYADIHIEYKGYRTAQELRDGLRNHEVDVIFPALADNWITERNELVPSDPAVKANFNIIYIGAYPDMSKARIAVSRRNPVMEPFRMLHYPKNDVVYYDDIYECMEGIKKGEADVIIVSSLRSEYILRKMGNDPSLNTAQLTNEVPLGLAGLSSFDEGIRIINHGISLMDNDFALVHAYSYMPKNEVTVTDFLRKNIWIPVGAVVLIATLIVYFISRENIKNREHLEESEQHRQELSDKVEEISVLNKELQERQSRIEEFAAETETHLMETQVLNELLQEQQTKLEETIEAAEAANKAKSTFLFNMSHDIRTPLNAIIGFIEMEARHPDNYEKTKENRQKIKTASYQLLDILNSVLEMARIENKNLFIEEELTDAHEMLDSCLIVFEGETKNKNLALTSSLELEHRFLYIDKTHLSEAVMNVISNAVKYTPNGGSIFVGARELPGDTEDECILEVTVRDNGIGMSEEFIAEIFDQFSRDRNSTQSGIQGSGLGMAIVKALINKMKGTITVNSKLGEGTEIIICTPHRIGEIPETEAEQTTEEAVDFTGKRILMAEDNELNAEIATFILEDAGFEVERAEDGVVCFDMLVKHDAGYYDLILMDIQMPNLDGYGATEMIRRLDDESKCNIPIVALTANAFKEDQEKAFSVGMNAHLAKPIDVEKTLSTLGEILK